MKPRIGSLCSGYGGLDLAIEEFFDAETAWFSEFESAPSKILEAHWPGVPNLGDMTKIDWASVEPVDIIAGGTPCQDLSAAGKRKGMTEGTRSNLWVQMREAVAVIRPSIVIWENVRGAYSACADSDIDSALGRCPRCVDPKSGAKHSPNLRAVGRVLGDLSDLGYDTEWVGVRASDAGAPHARFRVFVLAHTAASGLASFRDGTCGAPSRGSGERLIGGDDRVSPSQDADFSIGGEWWESAPGQAEGGRSRADAGRRGGAPTADTAGCGRDGWSQDSQRQTRGRVAVAGSRADAAADPERVSGERWRGHRDLVGASGTGETHGEQRERHGDAVDDSSPVDWGNYRPAIERWERVLGRPAPSPTRGDGKGATQRLSAVFVEWMMGLDEGWVTDPEIGLTRNEELKALGNGVVRQQAVLALSILWPRVLESLAVAA